MAFQRWRSYKVAGSEENEKNLRAGDIKVELNKKLLYAMWLFQQRIYVFLPLISEKLYQALPVLINIFKIQCKSKNISVQIS